MTPWLVRRLLDASGGWTFHREMLRGLEHMARYIDESFEEQVDELDPPID